jgi:hypothetical protein
VDAEEEAETQRAQRIVAALVANQIPDDDIPEPETSPYKKLISEVFTEWEGPDTYQEARMMVKAAYQAQKGVKNT